MSAVGGFGAAEKGSFFISPLEGIFGIPRGGLSGSAPTEAPCGRWKVSVVGGDLPAGGLKGGDAAVPPGENGSKDDLLGDDMLGRLGLPAGDVDGRVCRGGEPI